MKYFVDIEEHSATPGVTPGWKRISEQFDTREEAEKWQERLSVPSRIDERRHSQGS